MRDVPDYTEMTSEDNFKEDSKVPGQIDEGGRFLKGVSKSWEKTNDHDIQGMLNLTYNTAIFGKHVEFKVGAMDRNKERNNYYNEYSLSPKTNHTSYSVQSTTDTANWAFSPVSAGAGDAYGNGRTYTENEDITAYYAQAKCICSMISWKH